MEILSTSNDKVLTTRTEYWKIDGEDILYGNIFSGSILDVAQIKENAEMRMNFLFSQASKLRSFKKYR